MAAKLTRSELVTPDLARRVVSLRRRIHMQPELKYEEKETQALVLSELSRLGIRGRKIAGTGVQAVIEGAPGAKAGGKTKMLMLRADMDALPIEEETESEYKSRVKGVMHACGHDAHVAMLLAAAALLKEKPVAGPVKLCFQPAEEGGVGAQVMIDEGILDDPPVGAAFGIHVWSVLASGKMGIVEGPCMAAVDEFEVRVKGKGGHAAYPQASVDPILIAAQITTALQSIVSRNIDPIDTAVVTVAGIHGGTTFNIIPPEVKMLGTCRTFTDENRRKVKKRFYEIVKGIAKSMGGSAEIEYKHMIPATVNDKRMCGIMRDAAAEVLGKKKVVEIRPTMGGEDMSLYLRKVPGCFAFLGASDPKKGPAWPHHHPKFDIDESVLPLGIEILYRAAERYWAQ